LQSRVAHDCKLNVTQFNLTVNLNDAPYGG